jgi:hypothetical protein
MEIRADDRVLVTSLESFSVLRQIAVALPEGSLVGIGGDEEVRAARRQFAELDYVLFTPGSRDDIPWRDGSFTLILDPTPESPTAEMRRVLRADGRIAGLPATEAPAT